jgi:hypothetical protein
VRGNAAQGHDGSGRRQVTHLPHPERSCPVFDVHLPALQAQIMSQLPGFRFVPVHKDKYAARHVGTRSFRIVNLSGEQSSDKSRPWNFHDFP